MNNVKEKSENRKGSKSTFIMNSIFILIHGYLLLGAVAIAIIAANSIASHIIQKTTDEVCNNYYNFKKFHRNLSEKSCSPLKD